MVLEKENILPKNIKAFLLSFINDVLSLDIWEDPNTPILYDKLLSDYINENINYVQLRDHEDTGLLIETLEEYADVLDHDWLPYKILNLSISKAHQFLQEIKQIILEKNIEEIEDSLLRVYGLIENS